MMSREKSGRDDSEDSSTDQYAESVDITPDSEFEFIAVSMGADESLIMFSS